MEASGAGFLPMSLGGEWPIHMEYNKLWDGSNQVRSYYQNEASTTWDMSYSFTLPDIITILPKTVHNTWWGQREFDGLIPILEAITACTAS